MSGRPASTGPKKRGEKKSSGPKSNKRGGIGKEAKKDRKDKHVKGENPLKPLILGVLAVWLAIGLMMVGLNHAQGTLLPEWVEKLMNPGTVTTSMLTPGDGENYPKIGDKVQIEYTAIVKKSGRAFDTTQGRGPMSF
eukprot:SAG11_NODE_11703_length_743_cov_1.066770_1_plen_136_part_01